MGGVGNDRGGLGQLWSEAANVRGRFRCSACVAGVLLAGEGSNLQPPDPKSGVLPIELPAKVGVLGDEALGL
jgi:hypothetical protein